MTPYILVYVSRLLPTGASFNLHFRYMDTCQSSKEVVLKEKTLKRKVRVWKFYISVDVIQLVETPLQLIFSDRIESLEIPEDGQSSMVNISRYFLSFKIFACGKIFTSIQIYRFLIGFIQNLSFIVKLTFWIPESIYVFI